MCSKFDEQFFLSLEKSEWFYGRKNPIRARLAIISKLRTDRCEERGTNRYGFFRWIALYVYVRVCVSASRNAKWTENRWSICRENHVIKTRIVRFIFRSWSGLRNCGLRRFCRCCCWIVPFFYCGSNVINTTPRTMLFVLYSFLLRIWTICACSPSECNMIVRTI